MFWCILFLEILGCTAAWDINYYDTDEGFKSLRQRETRYHYTRCTRRFSPGTCVTPMRPMWTFVFSQQNCTERLGCPRDPRMNRYRSYSRCMRHCQSLIDLYTHILARVANDGTVLRIDSNNNSRREGDKDVIFDQFRKYDEDSGIDDKQDDMQSSDYMEGLAEDALSPNIDFKDQHLEFRFLGDVADRVV